MEASLSLLLPVYNAQSTLAATVEEFLEVLPELTKDFEVVIADDGSSDATIEVADELASRYPQVIAVGHTTPLGRIAAIRTALERSTGEILLVGDEDCGFCVDEIHRLWRAMDGHDIVLGRVGPHPESKWPAWPAAETVAQGGLQMLSRRVIGPIAGCLTDQPTLLAALSRQRYAWHEVEVAHRRGHRAAGRAPALAGQLLGRKIPQAVRPTRTDSLPTGPGGPNRPNYLARLKNFALGE